MSNPVDICCHVELHSQPNWNGDCLRCCGEERDRLRARVERLEKALNKIYKVTQFDHPSSQIIGSEEYEGAWLDCIGIAKEALAETEAERE